MPRVARTVVKGLPHHVTQRGNNRQDIFFTDDDRLLYLKLLRDSSARYDLTILAYCLMTNHVHLVAVPQRDESLARAIGSAHLKYTRYINRMHGRSGHLWQNRFFSCVLDGEHELRGVSYVERNPVRARLVRLPWRYRWSSAAAHCGERDESGLLDVEYWSRRFSARSWRAIVQRPEDKVELIQLRRSTFNGRPLGSDRFIARLESRFNRRLRTPKRGRPRREGKGRPTKQRPRR